MHKTLTLILTIGLCIKYEVRNTKYGIQSTKYEVRNTKYEIQNANNPSYLVLSTSYLDKGVTLSLYEHYWENSDSLLQRDITPTLQRIQATGFRAVRLPVAFDLFLQPHSSNLQPALLQKLQEAYTTCSQLHLALVITYHYGKLNDNNGHQERDRILWLWKQVQNSFRNKGYDSLFFELYNEPTLSSANWKRDIGYIVSGLRYEDTSRYYMIGGANYNSIDELLSMGKLGDEKLWYTFHFYEPYIFTHQGASWTKEKTFLQGLPYPWRSAAMPVNGEATVKGTLVESDYRQYPSTATREYIQSRIDRVAQYCKLNQMPLVCTETGVINLAEEQYRNIYLVDVTSIMHSAGIPIMLWDYNQSFAVTNPQGKPLKSIHKWLREH